MTPETITTFLNGYIHSLREETRDEKSGSKYGFDHLILKLAEADDLIPLRIAFHRGGRTSAPKPKKEHEYGEDLKVISRDGTRLIIFVLKDEPLTYKNWILHGFEKDLSLAVAQDLTGQYLRRVKEVKVILVYNKDDEARGVEAYDKFVRSRPIKIGKSARLVFERWNLTQLTEKIREKLITSPALLPEQFFRSFSYICWQAQDFSHGSEQWSEVLIPDWREFLASVLHEKSGEPEVRMVGMALVVLHGHGKSEPAWETGWLELVEWAMLALWRVALKNRNQKVKKAVWLSWMTLYLGQLEAYYERHSKLLAAEDSLACGHHGQFSEAISSHHAYWHMGRLGILGVSFLELANAGSGSPSVQEPWVEGYRKTTGMLVDVINANSSCRRPMLDIHHIELCLVWILLARDDRGDEVLTIFADIHERLILRRTGNNGVRLIDQGNSWPILLEHIATGESPSESFGRSSYLLQMLIELCACKLGPNGEKLAWAFYQHLIVGCGDDGESLNLSEKVELQSWIPPSNWLEAVLERPVNHEGICVTIHYGDFHPVSPDDFPKEVRSFVDQIRKSYPMEDMSGVPVGAAVLACIMHRSPLPAEFWRSAFERKAKVVKNRKKQTSVRKQK